MGGQLTVTSEEGQGSVFTAVISVAGTHDCRVIHGVQSLSAIETVANAKQDHEEKIRGASPLEAASAHLLRSASQGSDVVIKEESCIA